MSEHSALVIAGGSSAVQFAAPVVAVTLGPDSLCDACEVQGQMLTEGGVAYLAPSSQVSVRKARNRYHSDTSQGALVSLVGWGAGETPAPVRRDRWRYFERTNTFYDDGSDPMRILPAYGRRNLRAAFAAKYTVNPPSIVLQMVSYYGDGVARVHDRQLVQLSAINVIGEFGTSMSAITSGAPNDGYLLPSIVRGCGDQPGGELGSLAPSKFASIPLACDEVWVCGTDPGDVTYWSMLVEMW